MGIRRIAINLSLMILFGVQVFAANNFSGDSNCVAVYRFESGALTADSKGTNTLTNYNAVTANTTTYREGSAAANFVHASSQAFYVADSNLASGFPLKNGDSSKLISVTAWVRFATVDGTNTIFTKGGDPGAYSLMLQGIGWANWELSFGYNSGSSRQTLTLGQNRIANKWYHVGVVVDGVNKTYHLRIKNVTDNSTPEDFAGSFDNDLNVEAGQFSIGAYDSYGTLALGFMSDGQMDEMTVWNKLLSSSDIDSIRDGTYGAGSSSVADPAFDNGTGTYNNAVSVTPSTATSGATLCYTTDGATPGAATPGTCDSDGHTQTFSTAISVAATGTTIKVLGTKSSYTNSSVVSATYTLTVAGLSYDHDAGSYAGGTYVTITDATSGAAIVYCTDALNTCTPATAYTGPVPISITGTYLRSKATKASYNDSATKSALYTITTGSSGAVLPRVFTVF